MKLTIFDKLVFLMALISLIALPAGDALLSSKYPMLGIFTLLGGGLGIVNALTIMAISFLFNGEAAA